MSSTRQRSKGHVSRLFSNPWPDLIGYLQYVDEFNSRDFTYPEDVGDAFSGVTTPLTVSFQGGFLYGLPELFFDVALLWVTLGKIERRIPTQQNNSKSNLPSWSWMGWRGRIVWRSWQRGGDYLKIFDINFSTECVRTRPLVRWYARDKEKRSKRQVRSEWLKYKDYCYLDNLKIPIGWKRYNYTPGQYQWKLQ